MDEGITMLPSSPKSPSAGKEDDLSKSEHGSTTQESFRYEEPVNDLDSIRPKGLKLPTTKSRDNPQNDSQDTVQEESKIPLNKNKYGLKILVGGSLGSKDALEAFSKAAGKRQLSLVEQLREKYEATLHKKKSLTDDQKKLVDSYIKIKEVQSSRSLSSDESNQFTALQSEFKAMGLTAVDLEKLSQGKNVSTYYSALTQGGKTLVLVNSFVDPHSGKVVKQAGKGASGYVRQGYLDGKPVAVKKTLLDTTSTTDPDTRARLLLREFELMGTLKPSPYLTQELGLFVHKGKAYLVMEPATCDVNRFCTSEDSKEDTSKKDVIKKFAFCVASGLAHLHESGLVHRDIKPANIFLVVNESDSLFKLGDFGLLVKADKDMVLSGTDKYLPKRLDTTPVENDTFGFGLTLYELKYGLVPTSKDTFEYREVQEKIIAKMSGSNDPVDQAIAGLMSGKLELGEFLNLDWVKEGEKVTFPTKVSGLQMAPTIADTNEVSSKLQRTLDLLKD